ncbi:glycine cleavage system aminomethyltransferase GcvT [Acinetobacter sp. MD2]|uniref:glycine cleavage system aminomethyltransferase GcvT n=1 Tax=Acinetobacter sp. MD2 TaxID=2600066 RepID=UPI002D1EB1BD|nr:glycine cleavage system aminomethyltransferase GcvT [Acinetobacter sp. MD2]MEB3767424.1 glycine cleavage system aminomethyltransferase GcvT [Acinetobacter sp. MD2]
MSELKNVPLLNLYLEHAAKLVPFAGYNMPVQYTGVLKEHLHTREQAGLFDVSHMGQIFLKGEHAAQALEQLVPVDVIDLPTGMQRYAVFTNAEGGILDDLMIARLAADELYLVVNAACKEQDLAHLQQHLHGQCEISPQFEQRALLALQGPKAVDVLSRLNPAVAQLHFMQVRKVMLGTAECIVSRSGYTGEDGYEISVASSEVDTLARRLLEEPEVMLIGLGARDSLRLEAGLCLYGHDMNASTTPVEASLVWSISKSRRAEGIRAGGYLGADIVQQQMGTGVSKKRVGFKVLDRMPVREGAEILNQNEQVIGYVTSGGFAPSLASPIAMGCVETAYATDATKLFAKVRGKLVPIQVTKMPFVAQRYYRG